VRRAATADIAGWCVHPLRHPDLGHATAGRIRQRVLEEPVGGIPAQAVTGRWSVVIDIEDVASPGDTTQDAEGSEQHDDLPDEHGFVSR
jgi:hypothetical protein